MKEGNVANSERGERSAIPPSARVGRYGLPHTRVARRNAIAGRLNKQIAGDLGTVEKTVKGHRGRVMSKLGMRSVADLVGLAKKAGMTRNGS